MVFTPIYGTYRSNAAGLTTSTDTTQSYFYIQLLINGKRSITGISLNAYSILHENVFQTNTADLNGIIILCYGPTFHDKLFF
jgi:hypothetical protein